jgi:hypothetical protein
VPACQKCRPKEKYFVSLRWPRELGKTGRVVETALSCCLSSQKLSRGPPALTSLLQGRGGDDCVNCEGHALDTADRARPRHGPCLLTRVNPFSSHEQHDRRTLSSFCACSWKMDFQSLPSRLCGQSAPGPRPFPLLLERESSIEVLSLRPWRIGRSRRAVQLLSS